MFGIGMTEIIIVGIIAVCPLVVLFVVIYLARRAVSGDHAAAEETRIVQELVKRMDTMDERMSALETILLERAAKK